MSADIIVLDTDRCYKVNQDDLAMMYQSYPDYVYFCIQLSQDSLHSSGTCVTLKFLAKLVYVFA